MNNKLLVSAISITSALALMGGVTFALFSSTASNAGNTFGAGDMVLKINGSQTASTPIFTIANAKPDDVFGPQVIILTNTGSIAATSTTLTGITVTPTGSPNLGDKMTLVLYNDVDNSGTYTGGDTEIGSGHLTDLGWANLSLGFGLAASGQHMVLAKLTLDHDTDNTYHGTSVTFDFNFRADQ